MAKISIELESMYRAKNRRFRSFWGEEPNWIEWPDLVRVLNSAAEPGLEDDPWVMYVLRDVRP
jgi:hypothetical protein